MLLAGIRRDTGYYFETNEFASYDIRKYLTKFLKLGETAYDYFVGFIKHTGYFRLQRFNNMKRIAKDVNDTINDASSLGFRQSNMDEPFTKIDKTHIN